MDEAPKNTTVKDPILNLITGNDLFPKDKMEEEMVGISPTIHNVNEVLYRILPKIDPRKWLDVSTNKLLNLHQIIQHSAGASASAIPDFHYIPLPGTNNGERILHPQEIENPKNRNRLINYDPETWAGYDTKASPLHEVEENRSRELAWKIDYHTSMGTRPLLFVFTFDPHHMGRIRTSKEESHKSKLYWEAAAKSQGILTGKERPEPLFLYSLTGLHEWMEALLPPPKSQKLDWDRHTVPEDEKYQAAILGLDIYYSNTSAAFAWSTLEKEKSREKAKVVLQQILCKRIIIFNPIYGKSIGKTLEEQTKHNKKIHIFKSEEEVTARAIWENTIRTAHNTGASDIHIEPQKGRASYSTHLIVSLRQDNNLNFFTKVSPECAAEFQRCALEASGVTREEYRPQDGRKSWQNPRTRAVIDLRISVTPVPDSLPKIVMRLLDNSRLKHGIQDLGLEPEEIEIWDKALALSQSLVVVSGATNTGKSSTLYAALCSIYTKDNRRSITTIEDPIEYKLPFRSTQHQVNEQEGLTYERLIRQFMRNDGDTFLVGEIRDKPTLNAALQLGLTGHQILTTIHANNASETALRMLEFQPDPYVLSEVVKLIVAQKLAGTPCPTCQKSIPPNEIEEKLHRHGGIESVTLYQDAWRKSHPHILQDNWLEGEGCPSCQFTGILGKTALQEFLLINKENKAYLKGGNVNALEDYMKERGFQRMEDVAWKYAWMGRIPVSQAAEITNMLEKVKGTIPQ